MPKAFSTSSARKISIILLGFSVFLAFSAAAVGIDDNLPGIMLAFFAAVSFVLAFIHHWRTAKKFLFTLLPVSLIGGVLFLVVNIAFETITKNLSTPSSLVNLMESPVADALTVIIYMLIPATFVLGVVGGLFFFLRNYHQVEKIIKELSGEKAIMAVDNLLSPIYYTNPNKLSEEEKTIVYIEELEREINNGGFYQFFENSSGDDTVEVINSLRYIGSTKCLKLVETATKQFPNSFVPKDNTERQKILNTIGDGASQIWSELNTEFYKYEEDIYSLMLAYIRININKFR